MAEAVITNHAAFIRSVADLLRGDYKQSEYGNVNLPLVVLRRLDCVLEPTKAKLLAEQIAKDLDERWNSLERALQSLDRQWDLLQERRQALVAAAVTGQLGLATDLAKEAS